MIKKLKKKDNEEVKTEKWCKHWKVIVGADTL